ncbi:MULTISPECIES: hypothetical protein [Trichocoleus]|uniref:Site-specific integrase n=1 Tax=Trichocoleus desertorum GB2-A4 TaxID=2933944 RepID=A0ABV0JEW9_9CYAN|nr:hypothetical protein [Trichocoleus sp. FACHB-46]MBD1865133.1 hypothetical protein [Trichocoleus sp. FACHB-46]
MAKALNLFDARQDYWKYLQANYSIEVTQRSWNEFNTSLLRYVLPQLGFQREDLTRKITAAETEAALAFLKNQPIAVLLKFRVSLQQGFEILQASKASRATYYARTEQFLDWAEKQVWYPDARREKIRDQCCPPIVTGRGDCSNLKLTDQGKRKPYRLPPDNTPIKLQQDLEEYQRFSSAPYYSGRVIEKLKASSMKEYLKGIRLLLGFAKDHAASTVPLEELRLTSLVPLITKESLEDLNGRQQTKLWREAKRKLEAFICDYYSFLKTFSQSFSPHTRVNMLCALLSVAKFLYRDEVERDIDYQQIPIFTVLYRYLEIVQADIKAWRTAGQSVVDQSKKWPDPVEGKTALTLLRETVVEPLRLECAPRDQWGQFRVERAIAKSLQIFLLWHGLCYRPPGRQEELRTLKVSLSCPIQRPAEVPEDGCYFPEPPLERRHKNENGVVDDNYLYRTYVYENQVYPEGVYVLDIRSYKTAEKHGPKLILIRNQILPDGKRLYDYFDQYLCGMWVASGDSEDRFYQWWEAGLQGQRGRWATKGRMEFEPETYREQASSAQSPLWCWGYMFVQPLAGKVMTPQAFSRAFEIPAHRLIGKRPSPHTLRYIWATWAFQQQLSDREIEALAFAMGHTVQTLRTMYEKCTANEKYRAIDEKIEELLLQDLLREASQATQGNLPLLIQVAQQLSPEEQQQLVAALRL